MIAVLATSIITSIGRGLNEAFMMFWETLWALVLGFTLSGVVQVFISKETMQRKLGDHSPTSVLRASGFGMASSSCSYAASAMAKSLFARGADFVTAMVFMIASTNLVIELGIVLLVLLGWQFMAAEFVGGPIMIAIIATAGTVVFTAKLLAPARATLQSKTRSASDDESNDDSANTGHPSLRSPKAWTDASSYAVADVTMLRKELVIGYVVAGFLAVLVPAHVWNALFLHGHGFWTSLENALVGPLIAVISWVCSIGNVPLAAALWSGGISFGGVIAFIFADLITMPLIIIYKKFYGTALTVRLVALFYVAMVIAGLCTEGIFALFGAIPEHRAIAVTSSSMSWNYTTYLNIVFIVVAAGVWWLARSRARFGGGTDYAIDPVCGMQVRRSDAPATTRHEGITYFFCADRCRERFEATPSRFVGDDARHEPMEPERVGISLSKRPATPHTTAIDPMCRMTVDPTTAAASRTRDGVTTWFCSTGCAERFDAIGADNPTNAH